MLILSSVEVNDSYSKIELISLLLYICLAPNKIP